MMLPWEVLEPRISAAAELIAAGAHLVILNGKKPAWRGWQRRAAAYENVVKHLANGGDIGVKPQSLGWVVFDVDDGYAKALSGAMPLCEAEPAFSAPSMRPGRGHIFYPGRVPGVNHRTTFECGERIHGEVICAGMVRIYDLPGLARAARRCERPQRPPSEPAAWLRHYGTRKAPPALKLHCTLGMQPSQRAPRPSQPKPPKARSDQTNLVREGTRNETLFEWLRRFAFRAVADAQSEQALYDRLERAAFDYENAYGCAREPDADIRATAHSVARYTWKRRDQRGDRRSLSERQRDRGRASGRKRAKDAPRDDDTIRELAASGESQRAIAAAIGRARSTVQNRLAALGLTTAPCARASTRVGPRASTHAESTPPPTADSAHPDTNLINGSLATPADGHAGRDLEAGTGAGIGTKTQAMSAETQPARSWGPGKPPGAGPPGAETAGTPPHAQKVAPSQ